MLFLKLLYVLAIDFKIKMNSAFLEFSEFSCFYQRGVVEHACLQMLNNNLYKIQNPHNPNNSHDTTCLEYIAQSIKFSNKDFSVNVTHLLKKSLMESFIFCSVVEKTSELLNSK